VPRSSLACARNSRRLCSSLFTLALPRTQPRFEGWWKANRRAAPDLFLRELEEAVALIANSPTLGRDANDEDLPGVRRVLMRRTRHHVYYRVTGEALDVLAIGHGARGERPTLV
jgi:plasmid stabilization system protein ParE